MSTFATRQDDTENAKRALQGLRASGAPPWDALALAFRAYGREAILPLLEEATHASRGHGGSDPNWGVAVCLSTLAELDPDLAMAGFHAWGHGRTIEGDLWFPRQDWLTTLPADMTVNGGVNLWNCPNLTTLPGGIRVAGDFLLDDCRSLCSLPADLAVDGNLSLRECASLNFITNGLRVGGGINLLGCTKVASLPRGIKAGSHLLLDARCPLAERLRLFPAKDWPGMFPGIAGAIRLE